MNTNRLIVIGLSGCLVAGCCTYDSSQPISTKPTVNESIELVGFQPTSAQQAAMDRILKNTDPQIYRIQEYKDGEPVGQALGTMKDIGCDLEAKIDFWAKHPPMPGTGPKAGASNVGGRLGVSCSTSCTCHLAQESVTLADRFRNEVIGYSHRKKHHK